MRCLRGRLSKLNAVNTRCNRIETSVALNARVHAVYSDVRRSHRVSFAEFIGPGRATSSVCVSVCPDNNFDLNEP